MTEIIQIPFKIVRIIQRRIIIIRRTSRNTTTNNKKHNDNEDLRSNNKKKTGNNNNNAKDNYKADNQNIDIMGRYRQTKQMNQNNLNNDKNNNNDKINNQVEKNIIIMIRRRLRIMIRLPMIMKNTNNELDRKNSVKQQTIQLLETHEKLLRGIIDVYVDI